MVTLRLERSAGGRPVFRGDASDESREEGVPVTPEALLETIRGVVWYPDEVTAEAEGVSVSDRNLLMFLSDVRGRRFRRGVFLEASVLAEAERFRATAAAVARGHAVPDIVAREDGFHAVWRPLGARDAFYTDALMRRAGRTALERHTGRVMTAADAWLVALRAESDRIEWDDARELGHLAEQVSRWLAPLAVPDGERARLLFALEPPPGPEGTWRLRCAPPATRAGLVALGQAATLFPPLRAHRGESAELTTADVESFLRTGASALAAAGFGTRIPEELADRRIAVAAELFAPEEEPDPSVMTKGGGVTARLHVRLAGHDVSAEEIRFLLDQKSPFVWFHEHWIEIDRFALRDALKALESVNGRRLTAREALGFVTGVPRAGRLRVEEVKAHGWLRGLLNELNGERRFAVIAPPAGLKATLRDYQLRGAAWLAFLVKWGFGPLLADDMGLGKTLQTIAWMLHQRETARVRPRVLVVAPVSVVTNWMREMARFAPTLATYAHLGTARLSGSTLQRRLRAADVTVTGYSLLVKDFRELAAAEFTALVLDEAQMVKNADTRAAKAARALATPMRLALTGTPLENSAADLWSLQEFLNPGLLGTKAEFTENFTRPIRENANSGAAAKLRHVLEPFLLRRLKTDPGVAAELGAKREIRDYCPLADGQRRRYEEALAAYQADAVTDEGSAARRGRMLALLTTLKLICDGEGKLARLVELLEDIFAAGESALVFTQYVSVGRAIRARLQEEFGRRFPFLHGGLPAARREAEIAAFDTDGEPSAFILSLKAGGFGLNLTRATHVIHFDRWWNPAVENQATDRAHRIGQTKTVMVHLFISPGTLEDRIDELLESKRRLAGEVVGSGENFLLKMSAEAFGRVVALDKGEDV